MVLLNLDPTVVSEIKKTRPCVVISPIELNMHLQTIVVAPVTSSSKNYPTRVEVILNNSSSWVVIDQIRTIDKTQVLKVFSTLTEAEIAKVKSIIKETFVD